VLLCLTFLTTLPRSLGLRTLGVHLLLENPLTGLLGLGLVDLMVQRYVSLCYCLPSEPKIET
jgi:hypothetical protein